MATKDRTFVNFTAEQAAQYASVRGTSYPPELYQAIFDYHDGERNLLLDVGTGPGKVVFDLMPHFKHGLGCDASVQMIEQAKKDASRRDISEKTRFVVCAGEDCVKALPEGEQGTFDVVTVAMAAHWMDMPGFYASAAKALRPGGTLAIWTCSSIFCHPSTPNAVAVQEALSDLEDGLLHDYHTPSNHLSRNAYMELPLPWTMDDPNPGFSESSFIRRDWDRGGVPSAPPLADGSPGPFLTQKEASLEEFEMAVGSGSSVIRWRKANPEKAYTEEDIVQLTIRRVHERSGGRESFFLSASFSLLLMRKT